jgi:hypothetical protein
MPRANSSGNLSSNSTAADAVALLRQRLEENSFWAERLAAIQRGKKDVRVHLAIFTEPYLQFVLDGTKTVESRFSINRCAPFQRADEGDIVLLKQSGGGVVGICQITCKWFYHLDDSAWQVIKQQFARPLAIQDGTFWKQKSRASYASLFKIDHVHRLEPLAVEKRDRRGWVILQPNRK